MIPELRAHVLEWEPFLHESVVQKTGKGFGVRVQTFHHEFQR